MYQVAVEGSLGVQKYAGEYFGTPELASSPGDSACFL